jgi:ATP-dependent DNA helicase RecG
MFLGNGEKAGSGADIIRKGWDDNHWPAPELTERMQPDETMMTLTIETENNETSQKTSQESAKTSQETSQETDSPSQKTSQKIIELIKQDKYITTQKMADVLGIDRRNVARNIKKLQEQGVLERIGATKNGYWEVK